RVARGGDAAVGPLEDDDARVADRSHAREPAVLRPVVDDDRLDVDALLRQDRAERLLDPALSVVERSHHGDGGGQGTLRAAAFLLVPGSARRTARVPTPCPTTTAPSPT